MGVEFHRDWWSAVRAEEPLGKDVVETLPPAEPAPELKTRERESLLKLVVGMAIAGYSWTRKRSEAKLRRTSRAILKGSAFLTR